MLVVVRPRLEPRALKHPRPAIESPLLAIRKLLLVVLEQLRGEFLVAEYDLAEIEGGEA